MQMSRFGPISMNYTCWFAWSVSGEYYLCHSMQLIPRIGSMTTGFSSLSRLFAFRNSHFAHSRFNCGKSIDHLHTVGLFFVLMYLRQLITNPLPRMALLSSRGHYTSVLGQILFCDSFKLGLPPYPGYGQVQPALCSTRVVQVGRPLCSAIVP